MWQFFYDAYVQTYIERDIRDLGSVGDELDFLKFMKVLAARTGQLLNYSDIARDVVISAPTVKQPNIYYYRDKDRREIDVILEENGVLYPIEIKKKSNPNAGDIKAFDAIETVLKQKRGHGAVLCMARTHLPITAEVDAVPISYI